MIHHYTQMKDKTVSGYSNCINIRRQNNKYFYLCVTTLLGIELFIKLGKRLIIIDDLSHGNNKQSG